jgi:hypothetical protein
LIGPSTSHGASRRSWRSAAKKVGDVEYLFRYGGKELHVVKPGQHEAIVS